jgi:glutamyl-Q tRNA(Asp) synthetase
VTATTATVKRGRFAPSPTGPLHLGSLYTAVASYLDVKQAQGQWWLRIEDSDRERSKAHWIAAQLHALEHFGLQWDGQIIQQSQRLEHYSAVLSELNARQLLYACDCSRRQLAAPNALSKDATLNAELTRYPGHCRERRLAFEAHAWRLTVQGRVKVIDRLQAPLSQDLSREVGDFIVRRRDGTPSYDLAVVVDDAQMGINSITRGLDIWPLTPRQRYLQTLLGYPVPTTLHLPLLTESGQKLSKSKQAIAADPKAAPVVLTRILGYLRIPLPPELVNAPVLQQLDFAVQHWEPNRLKGIKNIDLT